MSLEIPFTIRIAEAGNPDGPDDIYAQVMQHLLYEKQSYLNGIIQKEVDKLFKERIESLKREPTILKHLKGE